MSLINEALKKAQKQQSEAAAKDAPRASEPPPPPPPIRAGRGGSSDEPEPEPTPVFAARRRRSGLPTQTAVILVGVVVFAGTGAWWFLGRDDAAATGALVTPATPVAIAAADPGPAGATDVPSTPVTAPAVSSVEPSPQSGDDAVASIPSISFNLPPPADAVAEDPATPEATAPRAALPVAAVNSPPPVRVEETVVEPRTAPTTPVAEASSPPRTFTAKTEPSRVAATAAPDARPLQVATAGQVVIAESNRPTARGLPQSSPGATVASGAVLSYLERARVTGIRVSETDPKVLMNGQVYRIDEVVDRDLQLRVIQINPRELRFQDPQGHVYRKSF